MKWPVHALMKWPVHALILLVILCTNPIGQFWCNFVMQVHEKEVWCLHTRPYTVTMMYELLLDSHTVWCDFLLLAGTTESCLLGTPLEGSTPG